jgi:hypothetical protein
MHVPYVIINAGIENLFESKIDRRDDNHIGCIQFYYVNGFACRTRENYPYIYIYICVCVCVCVCVCTFVVSLLSLHTCTRVHIIIYIIHNDDNNRNDINDRRAQLQMAHIIVAHVRG